MRLINSDSQAVEADADHHSAQIVQIDSGKHVSVIGICAAICGFAGALSCWSAYTANRAERETRMLEYYVNEVDGKLIHAGFIEPRDRWSPEKRQQYEEKHP